MQREVKMCKIKAQCEHLRKNNHMAKPILKGEAVSMFEAVGDDLVSMKQDIKELAKSIIAYQKRMEKFVMWAVPVMLTILGLILKFV